MPIPYPLMLTDDEALALIEPVLRRRLARYGFRSAEVRSEIDYAGDPSLVVTAHYGPGGEPFDVTDALQARIEAGRALRDAGDDRFLYVDDVLPEGARLRRGLDALRS